MSSTKIVFLADQKTKMAALDLALIGGDVLTVTLVYKSVQHKNTSFFIELLIHEFLIAKNNCHFLCTAKWKWCRHTSDLLNIFFLDHHFYFFATFPLFPFYLCSPVIRETFPGVIGVNLRVNSCTVGISFICFITLINLNTLISTKCTHSRKFLPCTC